MRSDIENEFNDISVNNGVEGFQRLPVAFEFPFLILLIIICTMFFAFFSSIVQNGTGEAILPMLRDVDIDLIKQNRHLVRLVMFFSNFGTFFLPGILLSILVYKRNCLKSVLAEKLTKLNSFLIAGIIMVAALPMVAYSFIINQNIPLPEWMISMEKNSNELISAILTMESPLELFVSLIVLAVIPAIGEEWIFRGILQHRLQLFFKNGHLAVWVAAILFSAVHMQFQGFIPRMLLGAMLGYMFLWSGSLWLSIFGHFINNSFQVIGYYFLSKGDKTLDISQTPEIFWWQGLISLIVVVALMYLLRRINFSGIPQQHIE